MTLDLKKTLPKELQSYDSLILKTALPLIKITITEAETLSLWNSKIGGSPYLPNAENYPNNKAGNPLIFLAQINFAETPALSNFPTTGILQFFIGGDDLFGLDFDAPTEQDNFRVIYYENVIEDTEKLHQDFSFVEKPLVAPIEINKEKALSFELSQEVASAGDYRFDTLLEGVFKYFSEDDSWDLKERYAEVLPAKGHKIGGYPMFTQEDPREEGHAILLLQIDTDSANGIQWGDMGVCNFFINPEDLTNKDFSKVWYNWDCY